jgi:hypothetical protein
LRDILVEMTSTHRWAPHGDDRVDALASILPAGWAITRTTRDVVPDGWISERASGLLVEGAKGGDAFRIWFLPRDWIGIRRLDPKRGRPNYWEGILARDDYTTITLSSEDTIPDLLRRLGLRSASIVNSGWDAAERVWRGRFEVAEATAERLIAAHCPDQAARDEAAYSLIVLGVPAASVFREVALAGSGDGKGLSISALSHFPGAATVAVVAALLRSPGTSARDCGYAGMVAGNLRDPALGPPLLEAFRLSRDGDTRSRVRLGLAELRYAPAGDALLEAMNATDNPHYKADFADALGSLRHRPAVPAIRALAEEPFSAPESKLAGGFQDSIRHTARMALLKLTASFGPPADGVRFLLEGPKEAAAGVPVVVTLQVENVSDRVQSYFDAVGGTFVVDGVAHARQDGPTDGMDSLHPNAVWHSTEDLAEHLKAPGPHRVSYTRGAGVSNTLTIVVR